VTSLRLAALLFATAAACSSSNPGTTQSDPVHPEPPIVPAPPATPPDVAFDVHEWGLMDVDQTQARLITGPPQRDPGDDIAPRRKPVLYFHLGDGVTTAQVNVIVTVPSGGLVEHFPRADLSPDTRSLAWSGLSVGREFCAVTNFPRGRSPDCRTVDGICEAMELPTYQTRDAGCIDFRGARFNHLFYRANGAPPPLPYDVAIAGDSVRITHARAADVIGPILYLHHDQTTATVSMIAAPAMGQSVTVMPPTGTDLAAAQETLRATMRQIGLTAEEIAAFDRAWTADLFSQGAARELSVRRDATAARDFLLYVMPASLIDGAARVSITPPPRNLRRFMLVRVSV
jgi:hypothetical protein